MATCSVAIVSSVDSRSELGSGVFAGLVGEVAGVVSKGVDVCVLSTNSKPEVERLDAGRVNGVANMGSAIAFLEKRPELSLP